MGIEKTATIGVGIAVSVLVVAAMITAAGNYIENVDSTDEWNDAILDAESTNYNVADGVLNLENSGDVTTAAVSTVNKTNVTFEANSLNGTTTVTVYDSTDTSIASGTLSGEDTFTADIADSVDEYYVEFSTTTDETGEVDSYSTKEPSDGIADDLGLLVIGLIGVGLLFMMNKV